MNLPYYNNYLKHMAKTPNDAWRDSQQEMINNLFEDTTVEKHDVYEESKNFDFIFNKIPCWIGTVADSIVNTDKDVNDYRTLYFQDCTHDTGRGTYYKWGDNYWLAYDSTTELETISNVKIRRCNNILKWIDDNGKLVEYPCILEYDLTSTKSQVTKNVTVTNSHVVVIVQGNKNTHKLIKNQRFLLNKVPYRFEAINNYMQSDYVTENVPLLFMDLYICQGEPDDDLINNIANAINLYDIKIEQKSFKQEIGFKNRLNAIVTMNGFKVDREVKWVSSNNDIVKINKDGTYEILDNGNVKIKANILGNDDMYDEINIEAIKKLPSDAHIIVSPNVKELRQYDTVEISANLYIDGVKKDDEIICSLYNLEDDYFEYKFENNILKLTALKNNIKPLIVTFNSLDLRVEESMEIRFRTLY